MAGVGSVCEWITAYRPKNIRVPLSLSYACKPPVCVSAESCTHAASYEPRLCAWVIRASPASVERATKPLRRVYAVARSKAAATLMDNRTHDLLLVFVNKKTLLCDV